MRHPNRFPFPTVMMIVAMLAVPALADHHETDPKQKGDKPHASAKDHQAKIARASEWIGMTVNDSAGKSIASVDDIVVRPDGQVVYVVLLYGATAGLGGEWHAAPMPALTHDAENEVLKLSVTEQELKNTPKIEEGQFPSADHKWRKELHRTFRVKERAADGTPAADHTKDALVDGRDAAPDRKDDAEQRDRKDHAQDARSMQIIRVSEIMGLNLKDSTNEQFGEVWDVLIDTNACRASFVVISYGGTLGVGESLAAAPFSVLSITRNENDEISGGMLAADQQRIKSQTIKEEELQQLASRDRASRIYESYERTPYWETFGTERDRPHDRQDESPGESGKTPRK